jgi:hypothetical protein
VHHPKKVTFHLLLNVAKRKYFDKNVTGTAKEKFGFKENF